MTGPAPGPVRPNWPRGFRTLWSALVMMLAALGAAQAQDVSLETAIKATYLVKLGAFVHWPSGAFASASSPFVICIAGPDPFGSTLDQAAAGQSVDSHPIQIRRLSSPAQSAGCHIMFIGSDGGTPRARNAAAATVRGPVLTITDRPPSAPDKGIINFVLRDNHVRFEIDNSAARAEGLSIGSQLMALAVGTRPER